MQFLHIILIAGVARASELFLSSTEYCNGDGEYFDINADGQGCYQVGGWTSAHVDSLDAGCTFHIYSDDRCSENPGNPTTQGCIDYTGLYIYSFSYTC